MIIHTNLYYFSFLVLIFSIFGSSCTAQSGCPAIKVEIKPSSLTANLKRNAIINSKFPDLKAETLAKQDIEVPKDMLGKPTIVCIAFDGSVQNLIDTWASPILAKFPNKEINYYEIPMIKTGYKLMRGMIDGGMRSGVSEALHNNVATYYGSLSDYKKQLMMDDKDNCYLFLLDKEGMIKYTSDANADDTKLAELFAKINEINNPNLSTIATTKDTIIYVFDPLCGFCYAFEPEIQQLEAKYKDKFVFEVISGGMILGDGEGPIGKVAPHIARGYKDIEKMSDARFGDNFLNKIMKQGTYKMSSEMPSIAVELFKSLLPAQSVAFVYEVQKLLYFDGIGLNEPENYRNLATKYGLNADEFIKNLSQPEWKIKAYTQFAMAEKMGVSGYPALIMKHNGKIQVLSAGFDTFENIEKEYPFK
jgi:putative protein-disulfide isomerase